MLDLVVAQDGLSIFLGAGDGSFALAESVAVGPGATRVALADLDGDGWTDLAGSVGGSASELFVLRNQHGPWNDLGHPLAGAAGLPRQTRRELADRRFALQVPAARDAKPLTTACHVVGIATLNAPFKAARPAGFAASNALSATTP